VPQRQAQSFADHLRAGCGPHELAASAGGAASSAAQERGFLQRNLAVREPDADSLDAPRVLTFLGGQCHAARDEDARQIVHAGQRHHHRGQTLVAGRDAQDAAARGQRANQPAEQSGRIVTIRQAVEHRGGALRAAIARIGACARERNRAACMKLTGGFLDEKAHFPMSGVIAQRDRSAIGRAHATVG